MTEPNPTDAFCQRKDCGLSIWLHREMDYEGTWQPGDSCEEFLWKAEGEGKNKGRRKNTLQNRSE